MRPCRSRQPRAAAHLVFAESQPDVPHLLAILLAVVRQHVADQQPPARLEHPGRLAEYVRGRFEHKLLDMTVVVLASGKAGGDDWQLAAVRGTSRSHKARVCLVHKTDGQRHNYGYSCLDEASTRVADRMTSGGGANEQPLWGLVPERTARVPCCGRGRPRRSPRDGDRAPLPATLLPHALDPRRPDRAGPGCPGPRDCPFPPGP